MKDKSRLGDIHRMTEQCLCGLGILEPGHTRAKSGLPQGAFAEILADLEQIWDSFRSDTLKIIKKDDETFKWDDGAVTALAAQFQAELEEALLRGVEAAVKAGLAEAAKELGVKSIAFEKVDPGLIAMLEQQEIVLSAATAAKISGDVKGQLLEAQRLGETMSQAMDRIQAISSLNEYQAERICRTELAKAANAARLEGYKGRVEKVEWVLGPAYNGNCACPEYVGVHTWEEAKGLPMGSVHPNCDCYWLPVVEGYED